MEALFTYTLNICSHITQSSCLRISDHDVPLNSVCNVNFSFIMDELYPHLIFNAMKTVLYIQQHCYKTPRENAFFSENKFSLQKCVNVITFFCIVYFSL